jgi:hypothetical protein
MAFFAKSQFGPSVRSRLDLHGVDVQIRYSSRARHYAEHIPESPRFPIYPDGKLGIGLHEAYTPSIDNGDVSG